MDENEYLKKKVEESAVYLTNLLVDQRGLLTPLFEAAGIVPGSEGYEQRLERTVQEFVKVSVLIDAHHITDIEEDRIEGLEEDLYQAVQVAFNRGAEKWALLNYPGWKERLEAGRKVWEEGRE